MVVIQRSLGLPDKNWVNTNEADLLVNIFYGVDAQKAFQFENGQLCGFILDVT